MFLGIDVGTGGTRAVLVDREGRVVASASSEHAPVRSEQIGWAEQQPEDWWRAAREAIAGAIAAAELDGAKIESIGLTGQMHGCVLLDAAGEVLRPALIWCDQRTQPECDWLEAQARPRAADRADLQPRAAQLHPHQAALGAHPSARNLRPHRARPLPQGLCPLSPHRRVRHRHAGGQRNASAGRSPSPLVRRGRRGRGHSHRAGCRVSLKALRSARA